MERKSFQKYLEKRLDKNEIAEIEKQAKLEKKVLDSLQNDSYIIINGVIPSRCLKHRIEGLAR